MRLGIDSYSYHRRYGEIRIGEQPPPEAPWPLDPEPVLAHARGLRVDVVMLETCYLPEPELLTASQLGTPPPEIAFSWGHPWPDAPSMASAAARTLRPRPTWHAGSTLPHASGMASCASRSARP